ncbi:MAG: MOSC domain-containing protein, partial [Gammaproteobacteria bacterium]|nr:MOSC domain-containing protein [Gammaproteobacteria bacterium]
MTHLTIEKLDAGLDEVRRSPKDSGVLELIVRRPGIDTREVLEEAELSQEVGLVGDSWGSRATARWTPHPNTHLT